MVESGNARRVRRATYVGAGLVFILGVLSRDAVLSIVGRLKDGLESSIARAVGAEATQWPDTLPVRAGESLEQVKKVLGEPTTSYPLADEQGNTILRYCKEGLTIGINDTKGLYFIDIREPWSRPIFGISLGEPISKVMESTRIHREQTFVTLQGHPNWFLYTSSMPDWSKYWCLDAEAQEKGLREEAQKRGSGSPLSRVPQAQPEVETVARISFVDRSRRR